MYGMHCMGCGGGGDDIPADSNWIAPYPIAKSGMGAFDLSALTAGMQQLPGLQKQVAQIGDEAKMYAHLTLIFQGVAAVSALVIAVQALRKG